MRVLMPTKGAPVMEKMETQKRTTDRLDQIPVGH